MILDLVIKLDIMKMFIFVTYYIMDLIGFI